MKAPMLVSGFLACYCAACATDVADPVGDLAHPDSAQSKPSDEAASEPAVRITVNPASATMRVGSSVAMQTVVRDSYGRQVWPVLSWSSSDTAVARVDSHGLVTAMGPGEATIAAECGGGAGRARIVVQVTTPVLGSLSWSFVLAAEGLAPLYDVWGSSAHDVFAVGSSVLWDCCGVVLHSDGTSWSYMPIPTGLGELHGVWGSSARDVFAVGWDNVVLHYDGTTWSRMTVPMTGTLEAVWGSSASDVYAVGAASATTPGSGWHWRGLILHYDGTAWTEVAVPLSSGPEHFLADVWGTSARDVFVVGSAVLHYDGAGWTVMTTPPLQGILFGVWGSAGDNVFAVGSGGVIMHYDGSTWRIMPTPPRDGDLMGIWGNSGSDVFAVGDHHWWGPGGCCSDVLHYDGSAWRVEPRMSGQAFFDVWTAPGRAFIVGSGPTIIQGTH